MKGGRRPVDTLWPSVKCDLLGDGPVIEASRRQPFRCISALVVLKGADCEIEFAILAATCEESNSGLERRLRRIDDVLAIFWLFTHSAGLRRK